MRDDQWERIKDLLPGRIDDPGVTAKDNRLFLEAVFWIVRTGSPWRDLPKEYGKWHSVYMRFSRWVKTGVWQRLRDAVRNDPDLEQLLIDSSIIKAHQHASGAQKKRESKLLGDPEAV